MLTLPELEQRAEQPYAFTTFTVPMSGLKKPADEGFPALFSYLAQEGIAPAGAPFYNYRRIDMSDTLDVEAGVPVARAGAGNEKIKFGTLPAGRFVTLRWTGHYDRLEQVTAVLIGWARLVEVDLDMHEAADGDHFACRLEIYETDPSEQPDPDKWVTQLAFRTAD